MHEAATVAGHSPTLNFDRDAEDLPTRTSTSPAATLIDDKFFARQVLDLRVRPER
jgi:hypothetical protein